jgi:hypothetical protein
MSQMHVSRQLDKSLNLIRAMIGGGQSHRTRAVA